MTIQHREATQDGIAEFLGGLLIGLIVGFAASILSTPQAGKDTRRSARDLSNRVRQDIQNPYGKTRTMLDKTRYRLENKLERATQERKAAKVSLAKQREANASGFDLPS
ncbi:MAG: YtxH domain-containing protein [Candidatus Melainabacteria bacterium]|nr:YtxH domain-containing protein [Candidatus Melainabacteria bacterium]